MINMLKRMFGSSAATAAPVRDIDPHLAAATLMVEAALADGVYANIESDRIAMILLESFNFDADRVDKILEEAEELADSLTDTYSMTSRAKTLSEVERLGIIEGLYLVSLADGERCAFEDSYIRHVASLIHVDDVSRAKARKRAEARHQEEES